MFVHLAVTFAETLPIVLPSLGGEGRLAESAVAVDVRVAALLEVVLGGFAAVMEAAVCDFFIAERGWRWIVLVVVTIAGATGQGERNKERGDGKKLLSHGCFLTDDPSEKL